MQSKYPDHEPKMVLNQTALLEILEAMDQGLPDLWDALTLTPIQRKNFFHTEPRIARLQRLGEILGVDPLLLVIPFDRQAFLASRRKTLGRPARVPRGNDVVNPM